MKKITLSKFRALSFIMPFTLFLNLTANNVSAQSFCGNELVIWTENFGTGINASTNNNVLNLSFQANGPLASNGVYRSINETDQNVGWHKSFDHTPADVNGKMLVINAKAGNFYRKGVTRALGYPAGYYAVSFFVMNIDIPGTYTPNPLLPVLSIKAEYRDAGNNWISLGNSPVTAAPIPESASPTWVQMGGVFALPTTGSFLVNRIRFTLSDLTFGGCGNDFAIDYLKLSTCPAGGPLPVQFLHLNAHQKGTGVVIDWATASEINNRSFDVEKSIDGSSGWNVVASVPGSINSSITKNYSAYDPKPVAGANYYRIRQVDQDGASKYSSTVLFNLKIEKTDIAVLSNPFSTNITIDFLSTRSQVVNCRLIELSGKQVLSQKLTVNKGSSRKIIDAVGSLNRGMYILQVADENGEIIYNTKLIKQ